MSSNIQLTNDSGKYINQDFLYKMDNLMYQKWVVRYYQNCENREYIPEILRLYNNICKIIYNNDYKLMQKDIENIIESSGINVKPDMLVRKFTNIIDKIINKYIVDNYINSNNRNYYNNYGKIIQIDYKTDLEDYYYKDVYTINIFYNICSESNLFSSDFLSILRKIKNPLINTISENEMNTFNLWKKDFDMLRDNITELLTKIGLKEKV